MPVDAPLYPVGLVVAGRPCLVVGGGTVAAQKVAGLLACRATVTVVAPEVVSSIRCRPEVRVEARRYRRGEVAGYRLVVAATGDPEVNRAVFDDGEAFGVWVNSADDPASCSFTLPAVVRHEPVVVAVSTGGHSPALATWLRDRVAGSVGPEHAALARLLGEARAAMRAEGLSTEGLDWKGLLDRGDLLDLVRQGRPDEARSRLRQWALEAVRA